MPKQPGYQELLALTLQQLGKQPEEQYETLLQAVTAAAVRADLIDNSRPYSAREYCSEYVRQALHSCYVRGLIVFGRDERNPNWPWYRVTEYGKKALGEQPPQPYDPDGFLEHFDRACVGVDKAVRDYVVEAVRAFNADCLPSSAVMLGCASEKLILLLCETFEAALSDSSRKAQFTKDLNRRWAISHKYETLRDRLDLMASARKLPKEHAETVASELPAGFELLRRCRNSGGHPDVPGDVSVETIFMNLRMFTEYARRVHALIQYFESAPAEW